MSEDGRLSVLSEGDSCSIGGLTPGLEYTVRVRARNAVGEGPDSTPVTAVPFESGGTRILVAPPNVRTDIDHTDGSLAVHWDEIPDDGGASDVLRYIVEAVGEAETLSCEAEADTVTCTLTGFEDGVTYSLTVHAISSVGAGPRSAPVLVTPVHTDDHGNSPNDAFRVGSNSDTAAYLNEDDVDYFRIEVADRGSLWVWSEGTTDTYGELRSDTRDIASDSNDGQGRNFRLSAVLDPGTYYIGVWRQRSDTGPYTLVTSFVGTSETAGSALPRGSEGLGYSQSAIP